MISLDLLNLAIGYTQCFNTRKKRNVLIIAMRDPGLNLFRYSARR